LDRSSDQELQSYSFQRQCQLREYSSKFAWQWQHRNEQLHSTISCIVMVLVEAADASEAAKAVGAGASARSTRG
jgi:hypothetical protein